MPSYRVGALLVNELLGFPRIRLLLDKHINRITLQLDLVVLVAYLEHGDLLVSLERLAIHCLLASLALVEDLKATLPVLVILLRMHANVDIGLCVPAIQRLIEHLLVFVEGLPLIHECPIVPCDFKCFLS